MGEKRGKMTWGRGQEGRGSGRGTKWEGRRKGRKKEDEREAEEGKRTWGGEGGYEGMRGKEKREEGWGRRGEGQARRLVAASLYSSHSHAVRRTQP